MKTEEGRKSIMSGHLGLRCSSAALCGLSVGAPFPLSRVISFHQAFTHKNKDLIQGMVQVAAQGARRLTAPEQANPNVQHFLKTPASEWLLTCGELTFSNPTPGWKAAVPSKRRKRSSKPPAAEGSPPEGSSQGSSPGGPLVGSSQGSSPGGLAPEAAAGWWEEPEHQDGGASILHMAMTLYGSRRLRGQQGLGQADMEFLNGPGSVYLATLTGPIHQVHHQPGVISDALPIEGFGPCSVTVQMRTALFPACQSRLRDTTPAPRAFFELLAEAFRQGLAQGGWQLPSLRECQAFAAE